MVTATVLASCGWRNAPQYSEVRYQVTGNVSTLTITAVTDELGTAQPFVNPGLPWSADYTAETYEMDPPVYLKVQVTPTSIVSGTATAGGVATLTDGGVPDFGVAGVLAGDYAVNTTNQQFSRITVVAGSTLTLTGTDNPFPAGTEGYAIFRGIPSVTGSVYGDGDLIASTTLQGWSSFGATIIAENYTAP